MIAIKSIALMRQLSSLIDPGEQKLICKMGFINSKQKCRQSFQQPIKPFK